MLSPIQQSLLQPSTPSKMDLDDINGGLASQEIGEKKRMEEVERAEEFDTAKEGGEVIDYAAEKKLVRKLDFW